MTSTPSPQTPAQRGDLVLVHSIHSAVGAKPSTWNTYTIGIVTSVTQAGLIKRYLPVGGTVERTLDWGTQGQTFLTATVGTRTMIDVDAAVAAIIEARANAHGYVPPYDSFDEAHMALRPHARAS